MEKVYLVLRNNKQSGPFTIGELLQQQLKPSDMIWIEGKSTAWTYLSELELAPSVKISPKNETSPPRSADEIERKAEELRKKLLSSVPKTYFPQHDVEIESYASPYKLSGEEIEFVDHRKEKRLRRNTVLGEFILTFLVIGLFFVGIYKGKSFPGVKKHSPVTVATQLDTQDAHAAQKNKPEPKEIVTIPDSTQIHNSAAAITAYKPRAVVFRKNLPDSALVKVSDPLVITSNPTEENREERKEATKTETKTGTSIKIPEELPFKKEIAPVSKESPTNEANQEERKGFLKGIFKKRKKENNSTKEERENQ